MPGGEREQRISTTSTQSEANTFHDKIRLKYEIYQMPYDQMKIICSLI